VFQESKILKQVKATSKDWHLRQSISFTRRKSHW